MNEAYGTSDRMSLMRGIACPSVCLGPDRLGMASSAPPRPPPNVFSKLSLDPSKTRYGVRRGGKWFPVPGLTQAMAARLWPNYEYQGSSETKTVNIKASRSTKTKQQIDGMSRGTRIDACIAKLVNEVVCYNPTIPFSSVVRAAEKGTDASVRSIMQILKGPMEKKMFLGVLKTLQNACLRPLQCAVPVATEGSMIYTQIDNVCQNTNSGRLVLVELKCGFDGYWTKHSGHMQWPLQQFLDCPQNQAHVQLSLTVIMCKESVIKDKTHALKKFKGAPMITMNASVLHMTCAGVGTLEPLNDAIYQAICAQVTPSFNTAAVIPPEFAAGVKAANRRRSRKRKNPV